MDLIAIWLAIVAALGVLTLLTGSRFVSMHSRRYGRFMSDTQRFDLFLADPVKMLKRAIPDDAARSRSLFSPIDDPAIERLRRLTLRLAGLTVAMVFLGVPAGLLAVGAIRRLPSLSIDDWVIPLFWAVLLGAAIVRRARKRAILLIVLALVASAAYRLVTISP